MKKNKFRCTSWAVNKALENLTKGLGDGQKRLA